MTLGFSQQIKGKVNYFPEKIWNSLYLEHIGVTTAISHMSFAGLYLKNFGKYWDGYKDAHPPKRHSIRYDPHNRWKVGNKIHPVVHNRTKKRFQFTPVLECKSVQRIEIKNRNDLPMTADYQRYGYRLKVSVRGMDFYNFYHVKVDNRLLERHEIENLAVNDGFDNADDFFAYFDKDFTGKIIHWTDLVY